MMERPIIYGVVDLMERIAEYANKFPDNYTTYEQIEDTLQERSEDPVGSILGIQVSPKWEDRCYGFKLDKVLGEVAHFQYLGIWKC